MKNSLKNKNRNNTEKDPICKGDNGEKGGKLLEDELKGGGRG